MILYLLLFILLLTFVYIRTLRKAGLPPGPKTLPFIGNLNLVYRNQYLHNILDELGEKYGGLFSLQVFFQPVVVISDPDILQNALTDQTQVFSDRPMHPWLVKYLYKGKGLVYQNGDKWEKLRRLVISSMRNFGVGKSVLEERIQAEAECVVLDFEKTEEKPFRLNYIFHKAVCNVICSVLFGKRFDHDNQEFIDFLKDLTNLFANGDFQNFGMFLNFPGIAVATVLQPSMLFTLASSLKTKAFVEKRIAEHRKSFDPDHIRDFIDMYLEAEKQIDRDQAFSDGNIFHSIMDVFFAGTESTSTTLMWMFLFFIKFPEIQDRCRKEVLDVVGHDRVPCMQDKPSMPYLQATIQETLRISLSAPLGGHRNTAQTTTLAGYTIPEDTIVITNFYAVHMNPKLWPNPKEFQPKRFLDEEGNLRTNVDNFMPFGFGRRKCLGDNLAKMELFLFTSNLLQRFKFKAVDMATLPGIDDSRLAVNLIPPRYELIAEKI